MIFVDKIRHIFKIVHALTDTGGKMFLLYLKVLLAGIRIKMTGDRLTEENKLKIGMY